MSHLSAVVVCFCFAQLLIFHQRNLYLVSCDPYSAKESAIHHALSDSEHETVPPLTMWKPRCNSQPPVIAPLVRRKNSVCCSASRLCKGGWGGMGTGVWKGENLAKGRDGKRRAKGRVMKTQVVEGMVGAWLNRAGAVRCAARAVGALEQLAEECHSSCWGVRVKIEQPIRMELGKGWIGKTQLDEMSNKSEINSEINMSVFEVRLSDEEITSASDRLSKVDGYHAVPPPIIGNFLTPRADISFAVYESVVPKPKINRDKVIIEDWNSDDEDDVFEVNTVSPIKTNETQTVKTQVDKIGQISQKEGFGFKKIKACFICKSTDHLIKDCNFYDKKSPEPKLKTVVNTGQRVVKPIWDNAKRVFGLILSWWHNGKEKYFTVNMSRLYLVLARPILYCYGLV
ncbi:hypothetical protein Tco_1285693 [Tanacetum coccineum]